MRRILFLRAAVPLVLALVLLGWGVLSLVNVTGRRWFEEDVDLRARLAISGARESLVRHWVKPDNSRLARVLANLARDDRIMAAAACSTDFTTLAATPNFPPGLGCAEMGPRVRMAAPPAEGSGWKAWAQVLRPRGGSVHVSAWPLFDDMDIALGYVILLHDMSYVDRREFATRGFALAAMALLVIAAAAVAALVVRLLWRDWTEQLRRLLRGRREPRPFPPAFGDVRDLVRRLSAESQAEGGGGGWNAERLRRTLRSDLEGERILLVANREPYVHERLPDGSVVVRHPASGLVTALEPVMRACSGVWIGHGGGSADRETADRHGRLRLPPGEESYTLRRVWLTPEDERGYYYGFSNEGIWPLCHIVHTRPVFRREDWEAYQRVNALFRDAILAEAEGPDPIIFVQDYHFALLPRMIRERLPRATILTFWHIPWPNSEQFGICPWHADLLQGLLGSSILGFHTQLYCNNFLEAVDRFLESRIDREDQAVNQAGRATLVRGYPISVEWPSRWAAQQPPVAECRAAVFKDLDLPEGTRLIVSVDRLDYTKGFEERMLAFERLLERYPRLVGRVVLAQLAAPSRTELARYRRLAEAADAHVARINERFGKGGYRPVVLRREHHEPAVVFRYYRAADACYVSSLHDGMNLVAKEFVAARDDERGVLVLSAFTGAARELTEALIVNPYDLEEVSAALAAALDMTSVEQEARMRAMRLMVSEFNVYRWAGRMLVDAARLRRKDRITLRSEDLRQAGRPV